MMAQCIKHSVGKVNWTPSLATCEGLSRLNLTVNVHEVLS